MLIFTLQNILRFNNNIIFLMKVSKKQNYNSTPVSRAFPAGSLPGFSII